MALTCGPCKHPDRAEIDAALVAGAVSLRDMARRFETSKDALSRHKGHLPKHLARVEEVRQVGEAETLLDKVRRLEADARRLQTKAEADQDYRCALAAVKTQSDVIELLWKVAEASGGSETENIVVKMNLRDSEGMLSRDQFDTMLTWVLSAVDHLPAVRANILATFENLEANGWKWA